VTVVIGGMFGQWITASIQDGQKEREFQQAWLKTRGDQALAAHKDYLDKEHEVVAHAFDLIGNCVTAARDLIDLTGPEFAPGNVSQRSQEDVRTQALDMIDNYNKAEQQWGVESRKLNLLVEYYHPGQPDVHKAWREASESVTAYMKCAQQWFKEHRKPLDPKGACQTEMKELDGRLVVLSASLAAVRQYPWEGWDSPDKLHSLLNKRQDAAR
jgi:hypothetical protein